MLINEKEQKIIEAIRTEPALVLDAINFILAKENPPRSLADDLTRGLISAKKENEGKEK